MRRNLRHHLVRPSDALGLALGPLAVASALAQQLLENGPVKRIDIERGKDDEAVETAEIQSMRTVHDMLTAMDTAAMAIAT